MSSDFSRGSSTTYEPAYWRSASRIDNPALTIANPADRFRVARMSRFHRWVISCAPGRHHAGVGVRHQAGRGRHQAARPRDGRVYPVTFDQAWSISKAIFRLEPTEALEEHRTDGYILTSQDAGGLSAGTYMGVFIDPGERAGESKVTFIARRRTPTQAYPALNEASFHKKFAAVIELLGTVGPLSSPNVKPDAAAEGDAGAFSEAAAVHD